MLVKILMQADSKWKKTADMTASAERGQVLSYATNRVTVWTAYRRMRNQTVKINVQKW